MLRPGATVLLFTDGLYERPGEDIDEGLERLRAVVEEFDGPLQALVDAVCDQLVGEEGRDDVALLAVRLPPGSFRRLDAVLFDLFGTIVEPYRRREHHDALRQIAGLLGTTFEELWRGWNETWDARATGAYPTIAENLRAIVPGRTGSTRRSPARA